jgi:hypothetical protein
MYVIPGLFKHTLQTYDFPIPCAHENLLLIPLHYASGSMRIYSSAHLPLTRSLCCLHRSALLFMQMPVNPGGVPHLNFRLVENLNIRAKSECHVERYILKLIFSTPTVVYPKTRLPPVIPPPPCYPSLVRRFLLSVSNNQALPMKKGRSGIAALSPRPRLQYDTILDICGL